MRRLRNMQRGLQNSFLKYDNLDKDNIQDVLRKEVGNVFVHVLEDAGVYKCTAEGREAFMRFYNKL